MTTIGKTTTIADASGNISNIDAIGDLSLTADEIEDTVYGTGGYKTFVPGLKDAGSFDLTLNYLQTDTSNNRLVTAYNAGTSAQYTITFPDSSTFVFTAFVAGVGIAVPKDEKVQRTFTMRIDGKTAPVFSEAS
jgi:hypothetical protein